MSDFARDGAISIGNEMEETYFLIIAAGDIGRVSRKTPAEKWVVVHAKPWRHHPKIRTVAVADWLRQSSSAAMFKHRRLDSFTT
jgi:hypothetical protein